MPKKTESTQTEVSALGALRNAGHRFLSVYFVLVLMALVAGGVYSWQHQKVLDLQKHQLPRSHFTSFEDCNNNGGINVGTINGQFNGCAGEGFLVDQLRGDESSQSPPNIEVFLQYSAQNLPRVDEHFASTKVAKSEVIGTLPADLVSALETKENGGCGDTERSYFKILKVQDTRFALLNYGCATDSEKNKASNFIYAINIGGDWRLLSPTNNIDDQGRPSCLMQDMFKISSKLAPKCFENTGYDNGKLKSRMYP